MIRDLSETLQAMLTDPSLATAFPELSKAQVAFDRPDENFKPTQTTIDLFLIDVRENLELRSNEPLIERRNGQAIIHQGPTRVACTYLVTAWPVSGPDVALQEQRLLTQVFQVLTTFPKIPDRYLKGKLVGQQPPLPLMSSNPDELKNPAEFWAAIGNKLKPSLSVTATIGMEVIPPVSAPVTITDLVRVGERTAPDAESLIPASEMDFFQIGGVVTSGGQPVVGANVSVVGWGLSGRTDSDGQYVLGVVQAGSYVLQVQSNGTTKQVNITVPVLAGNNYDVQL